MQELESGEPAELEIEAPPNLMPDLSEWGIEEVERGVCEDTFENRKQIRERKATFRAVFDTNGEPTGLIQVISAEMYQAAMQMSKSELLTDPSDPNADYLYGLRLLTAPNAEHLAPTWVIRVTRLYIRQQEEKRLLGADADLYQSRLIDVPTRCNVMKADGTRCWGWASGATESLGKCKVHARRASRKAVHDMSVNQLMRNRMLSAAPGMLDTLERLAASEDERIALTAARDWLDRSGFKAVEQVEAKVEIVENDNAGDLRKKLAKLREGQAEKAKLLKEFEAMQRADEEANTVDAEVVEE